MRFEVIGHPALEVQVAEVFAANRKDGPVAIARIRGLLESFDEEPALLAPAPIAQANWGEGVALTGQGRQEVVPRAVHAPVCIYVYEAWQLRFAIARVEFLDGAVVAAWLMVETRSQAAHGISSGNLSMALLAKVEELLWPI